MTHQLKILPQFFQDLITGKKTFEVRKKDRDFNVGDIIYFTEYNAETEKYTGETELYEISYILDDSEYCKDGYVILGVAPCTITIRLAPHQNTSPRKRKRK